MCHPSIPQVEIQETSFKGVRKPASELFNVQVLYLGEALRVIKVEASTGGNAEPALLVLQRVDEDERVDGEGIRQVRKLSLQHLTQAYSFSSPLQASLKSSGPSPIFGSKVKGGLATITERQVHTQVHSIWMST